MLLANRNLTFILATLLVAFSGIGYTNKAAADSASSAAHQFTSAKITVYKSPTCGCCDSWVDHLREEGFSVIAKNRDDMPSVKASLGVPDHLQSCHTATIDGYLVEGHVPAEDIKRLLTEKPAIVGLTAPGMPMRSPGMQAPGLPAKGYDVLSFDTRGKEAIFNRY